MALPHGQLTVRGTIIGIIGCSIITAMSAYTALKMGALPWPIVFAAIISLFFLKVLGKPSLNEANVTHTIMSAGAMVAGGLAFTIPAIWILGGTAQDTNLVDMMLVAGAGTVFGLICTAFFHRHFIAESTLEYPIGEAAAQTLLAQNSGGACGKKLFISLGLSALYTILRDKLGLLPGILFQNAGIPGIAFGLYNSPMMLAVGFIVGTGSIIAWFIGALVGNFGIIVGAPAAGLCDMATAQGITSCLGMGIMMGCGAGVIVKIGFSAVGKIRRRAAAQNAETAKERTNASAARNSHSPKRLSAVVIGITAVTLLICFGLDLGPIASIIVVAFVWATCAMSAMCVGQTGIDPMEIFGLIVLLAAAALCDLPTAQLFFIAGIIAVACGLAGDVMNDFHAGKVIGTDPRCQLIGQAIGGAVGVLVSALTLFALVNAYGPSAFGLAEGATFTAAQASAIAAVASGLANVPAFVIGIAIGLILYVIGLPVMMLGLGVYLPFYLSASAFLGTIIKLIAQGIGKRRRTGLEDAERAERAEQQQNTETIIASGVLGGESIAGIIVALLAIV